MPSAKVSKRLRREIMANQSQLANPSNQQVVQAQAVGEFFQGPLPDPETLEQYKNAGTSFPERIMRMAEEHNAADVVTKNRISLSNLVVPIIGQVCTLILGAGGILASVFAARSGNTPGAVAIIAGSFSPIIINAFKGQRQNKK
jgi:uncharacterized membrane protein